jgi:hypothetical protein
MKFQPTIDKCHTDFSVTVLVGSIGICRRPAIHGEEGILQRTTFLLLQTTSTAIYNLTHPQTVMLLSARPSVDAALVERQLPVLPSFQLCRIILITLT